MDTFKNTEQNSDIIDDIDISSDSFDNESIINQDKEVEIKEESKEAMYIEKLQRISADYENFRNRSIKEKANEYSRGIKDFAFALLPIIDNFERSTKQVDSSDSFAKGIIMIKSQMISMLDELGIKKIEAVGKEFDPKFHSAISHIENEEKGKNEIIDEALAGYIYKDIVIRHSLVVVAN